MRSICEERWIAIVGFVVVFSSATILAACPYKSIFSFGDSFADTGNLYFSSHPPSHHCFFPPYGQTFFHRVTGRCSDGRLIIDFIAESLGLPLLKPYLGMKKKNVVGGANFAVIGATALDLSFFEERGISIPTHYSLTVQLNWFKELLPSLCNSSADCHEVVGNSLFLMGEIGGNDFNYLLFQQRSIAEVKTFVPYVIKAITSAVNELIGLGARTLIVPGNIPLGCSITYLTIYETMDKNQYDQYGCLKWLNKFAEYYNQKLQSELHRLQGLHSHANIIYADYYNAILSLYRDPTMFGFTNLKTCCGMGGPYNYNASADCGDPGVNACDDPSKHIGWDGVHLTEAAYRIIAQGCKKVIGSSLFIVGEIGGNDYGYPLSETTAFGDLVTYIPQVISVITSAIRELIDLGAVTFMVPGSLPLGCNPAYLTIFATIDKEEYDQAGCLKWLNTFYEYHNELLQIEINRLRVLYPLTNIIYADYFNAALEFYNSPEQFGFGGNVLKVCCGGGGPYNYNETAMCGDAGVVACDDPSQYVSWDGYHLTEAAYRWMTKGLLDGPYTIPKFNVSCFIGETIRDFNNYAMKYKSM